MIRRLAVVALLLAVSIPAAAQGVTGSVELFGGEKRLDPEWGVLATQAEFGGAVSVGPIDQPFAITAGGLRSETTRQVFTLRSSEYYGGVRFLSRSETVTPFIEVGIMYADLLGTATDYVPFRSRGMGAYATGGALIHLAPGAAIGGSFRLSRARSKAAMGGMHAGVTAAFTFGRTPPSPERSVRVNPFVRPAPPPPAAPAKVETLATPGIESTATDVWTAAPVESGDATIETVSGPRTVTVGSNVTVKLVTGVEFSGTLLRVEAGTVVLRDRTEIRRIRESEIRDIK